MYREVVDKFANLSVQHFTKMILIKRYSFLRDEFNVQSLGEKVVLLDLFFSNCCM